MGKNKGKQPAAGDAQKKRKHDKVDAPSTEGVSLFSAPKDSDLGGLFGKSAAFAIPAPPRPAAALPVASSSKIAEEVTPKKAKKAKVDTPKAKGTPKKAEKEAEAIEVDEVEEDDAEGAESDASADLTHESLKAPKRKREKATNTKYTPPGETQADRDRRTVFVGNLDVEAAKSKSILSQLKAHLLTFAPTAKIESVRFRSVAFAAPTAALPGEDDEKEKTKRVQREKERAAAWREAQEGSTTGKAGNRRGDDEVTDKSKSFLDSKGKRKVAFIKKDFHSEQDSCNAYVVFAHPHPDRPKNVAPILDPFEAAEKVLAANGSTFQERTIRVDSLRLPSAIALSTATNALGKRDAWLPSGTDPKQSLFVGGLDYAAKDEDVRAFFEGLVKAERGDAPSGSWVTGVRIVRDKETQLGKGFGYVHFIDRESVDELIAMPSAKLKFAKKPLRVQSCKTLPPSSKTRPAPATPAPGAAAPAKPKYAGKERNVPTGPIPRGNPALGDKLKDLSKDERKAAKTADADRQLRRLAKKKAKVAAAHTDKGRVDLTATKAERKSRDKKVKAKKGRVRSSHALSKMKGQRQA
ncbi:Nucleolar protein 12 [Vanrija albida]|uniref:Nucleolar protein 12 n=1 Tax=Vanrija albida TaxID=181172 RepID=A0ABR3PVN6_9TREE